MTKVPATPPASFTTDPDEHILEYDGPLWRVYKQGGDFPSAWDELRYFGPAKGMRFDPHPLPPQLHTSVGVTYAATKPQTALAESFQALRTIERSRDQVAIASWKPTRPLVLLDLSSTWPVANGASASIQMGPKRHTQTWARAIYDRLGDDIDGLWFLSSVTGEPSLTLFDRTKRQNAWPTRHVDGYLLADAAADVIVYATAKKLNFAVKS